MGSHGCVHLLFILLFMVIYVFAYRERYGLPSKTLHVFRDRLNAQQRSLVINGNEDKYSAGVKRQYIQTAGRNKRSADVDHEKVKVYFLKDNHQQLMVHWVGEGSDVIMCLARDPSPQDGLQPSAVFISYDYGTTFENRTESFQLQQGDTLRYASVDKFFNHPKFNTHSIFTDSTNQHIFVSSNFGRNFTRIKVNFHPTDVSFYEDEPHTFLVYDKMDPQRKLWLTRDWGQTWASIQEYVKAFYWSSSSRPDQATLLYVEREEQLGGPSTVLSSAKLFSGDSHISVVISNVEDFQIKGEFMFATKRNKSSSHHNLDLYVSHKRGNFICAQFQSLLQRRNFHVVDVSDGQVMVAVSHTDTLANLYISEVESQGMLKFTLSLERILCFFPNSSWKDSWLNDVTDESFADLHKVEGLRGIYIASQVVHNMTTSNIEPEYLATVITFDHGGEWNLLTPPAVNDNGQKIVCNVSAGCSLHLSQKFNQLYPVTRAVPILSSKSAPGLIMATGTIGTSLKGRPGVFLSTDAGLTWRQVLKDYHFFNFGDHGGVMVAVKYYKAHGETRELLYSTDDGEKWVSLRFATEELRMYGLMTEPGENTTIFTMFGSAQGQHQWLIIKVDLKTVFEYVCDKNDYKFWSPSSQTGPLMPCVMGRKETYERRIPHSNCYNGRDYDRPIKMEICECTTEDFECDFGFLRYPDTKQCLRNKTADNPYGVPDNCKPGQYYNRTKGYSKIPGDPCEGGNEMVYLPDILPCPIEEKKEFLLVAQRERIARIDLTTMVLETLPISGLRNVIAIDFDMKNNCVYWADIVDDNIGRLCLSTGVREIIVENNLSSIEGMALDWLSNLLYFVDGMLAKIEVVRPDLHNEGRMRRTILGPKDLKKPRGIALHPVRGYMYWTDWAPGDPSVNRANLDGSRMKRLFQKPKVQWPNGVTIDHIAERIYWVDAREDYIASADLEGQNYRKIIEHDERVSHPFAVAVFKDNMYWDDWRQNSIFQADKDHGLDITALHSQLPGLMDLKVFAHSMQEGTNLCSNQSAVESCKYLCLGMPDNKRLCLCPETMKLVDGQCLCPDNTKPYDNGTCNSSADTCSTEHFRCDNELCIPRLWKCDGDNDCGDNSDEKVCGRITCAANQFQCGDGKCIPPYWKCDFDKDCVDGSDERNCTHEACREGQFQCNNKRCISNRWKCDLEDDCKDGSDEVNCTVNTTTTCRSGEFKCSNSTQCIPNTWRCDTEQDCQDDSDERNCSKAGCEDWQFQCKNKSKRCIFKSWRCDGDNDCQDGPDGEASSDEANCTSSASTLGPMIPPPDSPSKSCSDWMFSCNNRKCIPYWWKCDGVDDCGDRTDENGCGGDIGSVATMSSTTPTPGSAHTSCKQYHFQCDTGECIPDSWLCDGMNDCTHGEDERNCNSFMHCKTDEFMCRMDGSCIPTNKVCDQMFDCPDGTDEQSCIGIHGSSTGPVTPSCDSGFFPCDMDRCLPASLLCNGKQECYDGFDESDCTNHSRILQVLHMAVDPRSVTSTSFVVNWFAPPDQGQLVQFLPSISELDMHHTHWCNASVWIESSSYNFTELLPFSSYNVTVYVRTKDAGVVFPPAKFLQVSTTEGQPSPPWNLTLVQKSGHLVEVSWYPPKQPSGVIQDYVLCYTPPIPPISKKLYSIKTKVVVESAFEAGQNYSFWVVAENRVYRSNNSKLATLVFDSKAFIDPIQELVVKARSNNSITLSWKTMDQVEGYRVTPRSNPPFPNLQMRCTHNIGNFTVTDLAPGTNYSFEVNAFKHQFEGPISSVTASTMGTTLPALVITTARLVKGQGTSVFLQWQEVSDSRKVRWKYGIYYATTLKELFSKPMAMTYNYNYTVSNLVACESYVFDVGLVEPFGWGPLSSKPWNIFTQFNISAMPKNLRVTTDPKNETFMIVSWNSSCPSMTNKTGYLITIKEVNLNKSSAVTMMPTSATGLFKRFHVHYGGRYEVSVQTTGILANASTVIYVAPPIAPPCQLHVFLERNGSFILSWRDGELPLALHNTSYRFKVFVSPGNKLNMSVAMQYDAPNSPFAIRDIQDSTNYTFAVALETRDGYRSLLSDKFYFVDTEGGTWNTILSPTRLVSVVVLVLVLLVLVALIAALGFYVLRHRRLQRSFASFANSHYDTRSGAATFSGSCDGLDEEDSPVIRGFSDDEPLVIA